MTNRFLYGNLFSGMRGKTKIDVFWHDPFDGTAEIEITIGGNQYVRKVNKKSLVNTVEASKILRVSLVQIHRLIARRKLIPIFRDNSILLKMGDLLRYKETRKPPGRPKKEPFLIG